MNLNARDRIRSQKAPSSHYGACGDFLLPSTSKEGGEKLNAYCQDQDKIYHPFHRRSFSMSSSSDDGSDEEGLVSELSSLPLDEETPPPSPQGKWSPGHSKIRCSLIKEADKGKHQMNNNVKQPPTPINNNHRRVSFLEDSISMFHPEEEPTHKGPTHPARSREFQDSWRRKSSRRISALLMTHPHPNHLDTKKKTAQEHWALLREHVLSGRFFLDQSRATYGTYGAPTTRHDNEDGTSIHTRPSYLQKRHSSMASSLTKEIQSGLEFSLLQCVTAILVYLILVVLCFSFLLNETRHDWTIIDSMYFAVAMFTTVGFGDLTPPRESPVAHLLTSFFALSGVACLGMALAIIGHRLIELESKAMDWAQKDVLTLFSTLSGSEDDSSTNNPLVEPKEGAREAGTIQDVDSLHCDIQRHQESPAGTTLTHKLWTSTLGRMSFAHHDNTSDKRECRRRKQLHQKKRPFQSAMLKQMNGQFLALLGSIIIVSYLIGNDAGWNFTQTLYFAITTSCTIGFGDLVVTSQMGRLLVVIFIPIAVGAMGFLLQRIAEAMLQTKQRKHMVGLFASGDISSPTGRQRQRELTVMDLEAMDSDGDGNVDWSEFLEFMLVAMKKVDEDLMWELRYQFDSLDVDDTGVLSKENLIAMARRRLQQTSHKLHLLQYKQHLLETGGCGDRLDWTSLHPEDEIV